MVCFRRCCCCVNLRVGGIMMGVMTLALSVFSIIPMAIFLAQRIFMARVVTHLVEEYSTADDAGPNRVCQNELLCLSVKIFCFQSLSF